MQQGLDCTPDQNSTSDLGGEGDIYSVLLCKDTLRLRATVCSLIIHELSYPLFCKKRRLYGAVIHGA